MSFSPRVSTSVQSHIKYQSTIPLNTRKQKSNIVLSRSIQTQECSENQAVKTLDDIPSPPAQPFIGHLGLMFKNIRSQHKFHEELRKQYGNIVVLSIPGTKLVAVYGPEEGKAMYANEGKYPVIGGFEVSEFFRFVLKVIINVQFLYSYVFYCYIGFSKKCSCIRRIICLIFLFKWIDFS